MSDVFDEVEESLRAERYKSAFARAWPWLLGLLVVLALAFAAWWGWREYRGRAGGQASLAYQQGMDAGGRRDLTAARTAFARAADAGSPGYRALALMHQGALERSENDTASALRLFDEAAEAAPTDMLKDGAALQAAFVVMDTAPLAEVEARLRPLTAEGRPYRVLAREALAVALMANGRPADARREFVVLSLLEEAPETLRARASGYIQLIDSGAAAAVTQVARASAALPRPAAPSATGPLPPALPPVTAPQAPPQAASPPVPGAPN